MVLFIIRFLIIGKYLFETAQHNSNNTTQLHANVTKIHLVVVCVDGGALPVHSWVESVGIWEFKYIVRAKFVKGFINFKLELGH